MKTDNLQLVLLCQEVDFNYFGKEKILMPLLNDLQVLEDVGLVMNNRTFKVRLLCVLGDNLGSHWLGGLSTNFSANKFFCRYCRVERNSGDHDSLATIAEIRNPDNYNADIAVASTDVSSHGIISQSVLHCLSFFHVCMPGLPPCLGHDLFEGIVQYDLALILKQLCKKR
jgi:hypothetical protein